MRDHDSGKTLTFGADDMDRIMTGLLSGDREALILADELNGRWRNTPPGHEIEKSPHAPTSSAWCVTCAYAGINPATFAELFAL